MMIDGNIYQIESHAPGPGHKNMEPKAAARNDLRNVALELETVLVSTPATSTNFSFLENYLLL